MLAALCGVATLRLTAAEPTAAQLDFFEKKIRPILTDKCYKCHSQAENKVKGGLLADSKEGLLKGGDTGPAVVPGDVEKSLLIKAVRYKDENLQMPPKGEKLSTAQVADLEAWVKMGAPDPRSNASAEKFREMAKEAERNHWAFRPVKKPELPAVKMKGWVATPVDAFILTKLEEKAMLPSFQADKRTLIRRATFDLIGLPPTPEEVKAFVDDNSADAYEKLIDRLLASPHYGERWGRYWLDVARYSDTKGEVNRNREDFRYPYAWTYRDYVINSFNDDKPYDKFVMEQLAADRLPLGDDKSALAAMGFITLGKRFLGNNNDVIDDRIDVVSKGLLGLTVSCARCHDHKFDPIPTKDYYSWHGIFTSSIEPDEEPLLKKPIETPEYKEFTKKLATLQDQVRFFRESNETFIITRLRSQVGDYLYTALEARKKPGNERNIFIRQKMNLDGGVVGAWDRVLNNVARKHSPIFAPLLEFSKLTDEEYATKGKVLAAQFSGNRYPKGQINPQIAIVFGGAAPATFKEVADKYGKVLTDVDAKWKAELASYEKRKKLAEKPPPAPTALPEKSLEDLRWVMYSPDSPANPPSGQIDRLLPMNVQRKEVDLRAEIVTLKLTSPGAPPRAHVLLDSPNPRDSRIFLRGNASSLGEPAPRHFLTVFQGDKADTFKQGSGRLELAQAMISRDNPLTARVMVNRIWQHHFGEGIVSTVSDFGTRATPPTHPELLDWLASTFMDEGWSIKKIHRLIMLSSTYRQSSDHNPRYAQVDPGNKLLWRMNIVRLDFEALRDSLLAIGGKLDQTMGGQPVDVTQPNITRRTVYGFIDRGSLPEVFNNFDFANPDLTTGKRYATIVPQQSLYLMNNPLVVEQVRSLVQRPDFKNEQDDEKRVRLLYDIVYQRVPTADEIKLGLRFLESLPTVNDIATELTWKYGIGEVDEATKRTKTFVALPAYINNTWQAGPKLPHPTAGYASLTAKGGHPGKDLKHAVIRRWTAPRDCIVTIDGPLAHSSKTGDGVHCRVISSRNGEVGSWLAANTQIPTRVARLEVKQGDTIDLVTDCRGNDGADTFTWAPTIRMTQETGDVIAGISKEWNPEKDFMGMAKAAPKSLNAWEKYAHVLLLSNEATFIN